MLTTLLHAPLFLYAAAFVASVVSAATGMGTSMILLPLAALQFGAKEGVGIITIFFIFQNINKSIVFYKDVHWSLAWKVVAWSVPGVIIGSLALAVTPVALFTKLLAVCILLYLANELFSILPKKKASDALLPATSILYGFLSGMLGSGNMVKGPMFVAMGLRKNAYIGTCAVTAFFMNIPKLISYYATGIIDESSFIKAIPFLLMSTAGTWIGKHFLHKIPHNVFYYVVMASFAFSAIVLLFE